MNSNVKNIGFRAAGYSTALTDAQMVLTTGGNVGIGTTGPSTKLHVVGQTRIDTTGGILILNDTTSGTDAATSNYLSFQRGAVEKGWVGFGDGSSGLFRVRNGIGNLRLDASGEVQLWTNSSQRVTVDTSGNVGINTISPSAKLNVHIGDIAITATAGVNTRDNRFLSIYRGSLGADSAGVIFGTGPSTNNWFIGHPYSGGGVFNALVISERELINDGGATLVKVPHMYFSPGSGTAAGNVGIGMTSAPNAPIDIDANGSGATIYTGYIRNGSTSTSVYNTLRFTQGAGGSATGIIGTGGSATANAAFQNTFVVGTQGAHSLVLVTNDTRRVTIDSTGHVSASLNITAQGNGLRMGSVYTSDNDYMGLKAASQTGTNDYMIISGKTSDTNTYISAGAGAAVHVRAGGNDSTHGLVVTPSAAYFNGKLGIGVTGPSTFLDIGSNGNVSAGNISLGARSNNVLKYTAITSAQYATSSEPEGFMLIGSNADTSTNVVRIGGGIDEVNAATSIIFFTAANATTRTGTTRMTIDSSGRIGIGTSPSYTLHVSGDIYATANITAYSDRRAKKDIITIDNALAKVNSLRGVYYNRIDDEKNLRNVGVIAQEVLEVVPELVSYAEDIDQYSVKYGNITAVLIEAVKELSAKVDRLQKQVDVR